MTPAAGLVGEFVTATVYVEGQAVACLSTETVGGTFCNPAVPVADQDHDAAQLQASLEAHYGTGAVSVTGAAGGQGTIGSGEPLIVRANGLGLAPIKVAIPFAITITGSTSTRVLSEGGSGRIVLQVYNLGDKPIEGNVTPIVLTDKLPAGVVATGIAGGVGGFPEEGQGFIPVDENGEEHIYLTCSYATVSCAFTGTLQPYERLELVVWVNRTGAGGGGEGSCGAAGSEENCNRLTVNGGGVPVAEAAVPVKFGEGPVPFGVESLQMRAEEEGGVPATQAGGHPFQLTSMLRFNETSEVPFQPQQPRNLSIQLPAGFVGNAQAVPKCSLAEFSRRELHVNACPTDATVGVAGATLVSFKPPSSGFGSFAVPVFNLTPATGEPARFGFYVSNVVVVLDTYLRADGDYGVTTTVQNLSEATAALSSVVTLWGDPGSAVHNRSRGWGCFPEIGQNEQEGCGPSLGSEKPFLTLPSSCQVPFQSSVSAQSWLSTSMLEPVFSASEAIDGCSRETFEPELQVQSSANAAYTPAELKVHLKVPQQASESPGGIAAADVRNTKVTLPAGLQLNPAAAAGLEACTTSDIGYIKTVGEELIFDEESPGERDGEESHLYFCPEGSKLGTVKVKTPLLEEELTGVVYQAAQNANPFGSLLALYIIAEAPKTGVRVRLAGEAKVEPGGQIVSTFDHTPQVPFEEFEVRFFGGGKAPLATTGCGTYTTTSLIESWAGGEPVAPFSSFDVSSGCSSPGFAPSFTAGTTNNHAGAFSPFTMTLTRKDGEQTFSTVNLTMPPGLAGMLSKVTLCGEAQANAGTCGAASKIGYVRVSAGVGNEPVVLPEAGKGEDPVYLTHSYKGAPFGLSIVVPAEAGPFNLDEGGHPVIVRAKVEVNPHTAQVSIDSEPMPTELHNIGLQVRSIEVVVDKPGFIFNPTNCNAMGVTGTIGSSTGISAAVKSRFQASSCAALPFKPQFKAYTHAYHSKRKGAYLQVVVTSGEGQANIGKVHVTLPKTLPTRQETLKFACSEAQFAKNPFGCPHGAFVGTAKATTPVLPVPLTGPAIFVSHGGAEFPNLDVVLQGDGVTVELVGDTLIKKGITTSTFASVPDVPVERFSLTLPEGKYSALAGEANFCRTKPMMPTTITGQNGAVIEHDTKIAVTGCKVAKKAKGKKASAQHKKHK